MDLNEIPQMKGPGATGSWRRNGQDIGGKQRKHDATEAKSRKCLTEQKQVCEMLLQWLREMGTAK